MLTAVENIHRDSPLAKRDVVLSVQSVGNDEAATLFDSYKPGFPFEVVGVQHFAEAIVATASYDVQIGSTSVLAAAEVPTADTREDGVLSATWANRLGGAADELNLKCTTNASGTLTGLKVKVTIIPQGCRR